MLERIAATAQRAPSAGFSQGQRIVIVTEPERRRRLAELASEEFYRRRGFDPWISEAPALFVPAVSAKVYVDRYNEPDKRDPSAPPGTEDEWPVRYWWMDVGCSVMLILLAAVDEGLAAGFAGGDLDGIRAEVGLPEDYTGRRHPCRPAAPRRQVAVAEARVAEPGGVHALGGVVGARTIGSFAGPLAPRYHRRRPDGPHAQARRCVPA